MFAFCFSGLQLGFFPVARPEVVEQNSVFDKKIIMDLIRIDCYFEKLEVFIRFLCQLFQLTLSVGQQKSKLFTIFRLSSCSIHVWAFRAELFITFVTCQSTQILPFLQIDDHFFSVMRDFCDFPTNSETSREPRERDGCHADDVTFVMFISFCFDIQFLNRFVNFSCYNVSLIFSMNQIVISKINAY